MTWGDFAPATMRHLAAGTPVMNTASGSTDSYTAAFNQPVPDELTHFSGTITGADEPSFSSGFFRPQTAAVAPVVLKNDRSGDANSIRWQDIVPTETGPDAGRFSTGQTISLRPVGLSDADGWNYTWTQTVGPSVATQPGVAGALDLTVPSLVADAPLIFEATATSADGSLTQTETIAIVLEADPSLTVEATAEFHPSVPRLVTLSPGTTLPAGVTRTWEQTAGSAVTLVNAGSGRRRFAAPDWVGRSELSFRLTVSDGLTSASSDVSVTVPPADAAEFAATASVAGQPVTGVIDASQNIPLSTPAPAGATHARWEQVGGPAAVLSNAATASPVARRLSLRKTQLVASSNL